MIENNGLILYTTGLRKTQMNENFIAKKKKLLKYDDDGLLGIKKRKNLLLIKIQSDNAINHSK